MERERYAPICEPISAPNSPSDNTIMNYTTSDGGEEHHNHHLHHHHDKDQQYHHQHYHREHSMYCPVYGDNTYSVMFDTVLIVEYGN
jgi:hypothetical protein